MARIGERRGVSVSVEEPEGKRKFERPETKWEENIRLIFKKWDKGMDFISLI